MRAMRSGSGLRSSLLLFVAVTFLVTPGFDSDPVSAQTAQPNIVFILTDDQRWDTLWAMPAVQRELVGKGVTFSEAFVVNPLCCPSRASILAGQYSRNTKVYKNNQMNLFDDTSTMATILDSAGYHTGLIGKYFVGYYDDTLATYVPPGWDEWFALSGAQYYGYAVSDNGQFVQYGSAPADYVTDVLAAEAVDFIQAAPADEPLFLYFAPTAPHEPAQPASRHNNLFRTLPAFRPPSWNEADVSDKPAYVRAKPAAGSADGLRRKMYETLQAVDEAVEDLIQALTDTGRLENTVIAYMSDHGFLWKEHRLGGKVAPYEESIRIPMVIRYDPWITSPRIDDNMVLNIDLAPTFTELAGQVPTDMDGLSMVSLLAGPGGAALRSDFLIEHVLFAGIPTYCAVRNDSWIYIYYSTGERELYDLVNDPYQLASLHADPAYTEVRDTMHERLRVLCSPQPPRLNL
jgi:arylsulfatase A-like enzyme